MASNNTRSDKYFAADEVDVLVSYLDKRAQDWFQALTTSDYLDKIKRSWQAYHGIYYENSHTVSFGGENGELVNMPVNHFANIAQNTLTMVTATRPSFQARAINTDLKSTIQTNLANGLLDFYMRDKRLEKDLKLAAEYAIVLGTGYIKMEWNATAGRIVDEIEPEFETAIDELTGEQYDVLDDNGAPKIVSEGFPIYEGDVEFSTLSPLDVVFDTSRETTKMDWQLCRTFKNKYDLAAKYPEFHDDIVKLETKTELYQYRLSLTPYDETVDIPVYEFFHRPTEALPRGRYVLYLSPEVVLVDDVLPYQKLPIFRISYRDILGTPFGYTNMFDLLPLQEEINALYSTAVTNNHTFGIQNIVSQSDSGLTINELSGGLNHIQVNDLSQAPRALQLTQTSPETYNLIQMLVRDMEVISGINSVARGNPDPKQQLRSGNSLALVQAQALQFVSPLQQSYIQLIEDVGTNLILMLQRFATSPRVAEISGIANATYIKWFTGGDLNAVNRVVVDAGNALMQTTAGRFEIAQNLVQMGIIKAPEELMSVLNTGKLENLTESQNKQTILIRAENEALLEGREVRALLTDDHNLHLREHQAVLADPTLRFDDELVDRTLAHIQEHINILSNPNVANILTSQGQTPIAPPQQPQPAPQPVGNTANVNAAAVENTQDLVANAQAQSVATAGAPELPAPAQPAVNDQGLPQTPEQLYAQNTGGAS
jgi:hypothetical protein